MKKTFAVLAIATLGFAACGDDDDPADDTGSEDTTEDTGSGDTTTEDTISQTTMSDDTVSDDTSTEDTMTDDTGESSGTNIPETLEQAKEQLVNFGISEEDADCVIDKAFEAGMDGVDPSDMDAMQQIFEDCNVDLTELGG